MSTPEQIRDAAPATATPHTRQYAPEIQAFGHLVSMPIALSATTRKESVANLYVNGQLAHTMAAFSAVA